MSHYIGLVFVPSDNDLDTMLAPYDEQTDNEEFIDFVDCTKEVKEKYESLPDTLPAEGKFTEEIDKTDEVNEIWEKSPDELSEEQKHSIWQPYSKDRYPTPADIAKDKGYSIENGRFIQRVERDYKHTPTKEKYPTIGVLAKEYFGYKKDGDRYGYRCNPEAKWDWYVVGGRWDGELILKNGKTANEAQLEDIDWDEMLAGKEVEYTDWEGKPYTAVENHIPRCFVDTAGNWYERGKMIWFGMSVGDKDKGDWENQFRAFIKDLLDGYDPENDPITVYAVDYHI